MTLDLERLHSDAANFQQERVESFSSRETTGTTKAIREALPEIYRLREKGMLWSVIAAALSAQGVVQGKDRRPLTAKRLTAIVRQLEQQAERRIAKTSKKIASLVASRNFGVAKKHGLAIVRDSSLPALSRRMVRDCFK